MAHWLPFWYFISDYATVTVLFYSNMSSSALKDSTTDQTQLTTRQFIFQSYVTLVCKSESDQRFVVVNDRDSQRCAPMTFLCLFFTVVYIHHRSMHVYMHWTRRERLTKYSTWQHSYMDSIHFNAAHLCNSVSNNHAYNYVQGTRVVCRWWWKTHSTLHQCSQDQFDEINLSLISSSMKAYGVMLSSYMSTQFVYVRCGADVTKSLISRGC